MYAVAGNPQPDDRAGWDGNSAGWVVEGRPCHIAIVSQAPDDEKPASEIERVLWVGLLGIQAHAAPRLRPVALVVAASVVRKLRPGHVPGLAGSTTPQMYRLTHREARPRLPGYRPSAAIFRYCRRMPGRDRRCVVLSVLVDQNRDWSGATVEGRDLVQHVPEVRGDGAA